ncbi:transcription factor bHLH114 [Dendrobium catenatum]|uniref:Transcription factor bHLH112 n=1 Tax=Dendrobium catenatum TaxID=906689 RepID=A0A2I0W6J3_9ASPA|nr:transcription factor bHLH114 [Dendrobium catenatum]PKU71277.1 Transcription factor bHLH112 [Dendrobium catenatum]
MAEEFQGSVSSFNFWSSLRCSDIFSCSTALNAGDIEETFGFFPASNEIVELSKANSFDYFTQPSSLDPLSSSVDWSQSFLESSETNFQAVQLEDSAATRECEIIQMDFTETSQDSSKDMICHGSFQSNQTLSESAMAELQILPTVEFPSNGSLFSSTSAKSNTAASRDPTPPIAKKIRIETPSPLPAFKVRKEKLGDRITALQQLVSPFGKTDTASVLHEAIEYIKYLHQQVNGLSNPYLINRQQKTKQQILERQEKNGDRAKKDLRSLGLCLVPISTTFTVASNELPPDFWTQLWSMENYCSIRRER